MELYFSRVETEDTVHTLGDVANLCQAPVMHDVSRAAPPVLYFLRYCGGLQEVQSRVSQGFSVLLHATHSVCVLVLDCPSKTEKWKNGYVR